LLFKGVRRAFDPFSLGGDLVPTLTRTTLASGGTSDCVRND